MNLRKRRIFKVGNSKAVALPPEWLRGNDTVRNIELYFDGAILVIPEGFPEERKSRLLEALNHKES